VHARAPLVDDFDAHVAAIRLREVCPTASGTIDSAIATTTTAAATIQNIRTRRERR